MWGPFAYFFHLEPGAIDRMTYWQFCALEELARTLMKREADSGRPQH